MITRRSFLLTVGALAGVSACRNAAKNLPGGTAGAPRRRLDRIGIQLYTVRSQMQRDVPGTLARLSEIGYKEVEFAGYFGRTSADVRQLLERNGLTSPSTHIGYDQLKANWDKALDDAAATGHQYITIPYLPTDVRKSVGTWRAVADDFNRAAERARGRGLAFAYHNHDFEFARVDGQVPYDILLANTDLSLVAFQMDVFWLTKGGGDPLAYIAQHPSRFTMLHIKDSSGPPAHNQVDVGAGTIDFAGILRQDAERQHAVKHVFAEHDQPPDALVFAQKSFNYLSAMEY